MEHDEIVEELTESFINGNRGYVIGEIFKLMDPLVSAYVATRIHAKLYDMNKPGIAGTFIMAMKVHLPS